MRCEATGPAAMTGFAALCRLTGLIRIKAGGGRLIGLLQPVLRGQPKNFASPPFRSRGGDHPHVTVVVDAQRPLT